jgi:hypothetical protein
VGGTTKCGQDCVNTENDVDNCGFCNFPCPQNQVCSNSQCALQCMSGTTKCGGTCTNTKIDPNNCGNCGFACSAGQPCLDGQCFVSCQLPAIKCNNACINPMADPGNCGGCGVTCLAGQTCQASQCKSAVYQFSGILSNVPIAQLSGWSQCYVDTYNSSSTTMASILSVCNQSNLLLGCRATGAQTLLLAANAPRVDVLFDTGTTSVPHNANNVGWYYSGSWSWGFAAQGDPINRNTCDVLASMFGGAGPNGNLRMCWHTNANSISAGWRCGLNEALNGSAAFERIIFQSN